MAIEFPVFLRDKYDEGALEADASSFAAIDAGATIVWTNKAWRDFAEANGGPRSLRAGAVGLSYLEPIAPPILPFYAESFSRALETGTPLEQDYECSSDQVFRKFRLRALPVDQAGLLLEHRLIVERPHDREAAAPVESAYRDNNGIVVQCANCRRVQRPDRSTWDWIPEWVKEMPPRTGHGICAPCMGFYWSGPARRRPTP
jgi:hypothetical protein